MFEYLLVSGPHHSVTSVAALSACSLMNAFCVMEAQDKAEGGEIRFHSEFAVHTQTHSEWRGWTEFTNIILSSFALFVFISSSVLFCSFIYLFQEVGYVR